MVPDKSWQCLEKKKIKCLGLESYLCSFLKGNSQEYWLENLRWLRATLIPWRAGRKRRQGYKVTGPWELFAFCGEALRTMEPRGEQRAGSWQAALPWGALSARRFPAHRPSSTFECCLSIWWENRGNREVIPGPTCLKETLSKGFRQTQKSLREVAGDRDSVGASGWEGCACLCCLWFLGSGF